MKKYKLNRYNPLTYLLFLIGIPIFMIISMFVNETILEYFKSFAELYRGKETSHPKKFLITIRVVTKINTDRKLKNPTN